MQTVEFKIVRERTASGDHFFNVLINGSHKKSFYFNVENEEGVKRQAMLFVDACETYAKAGILIMKETVYESNIETDLEELPF